MWKRIALNSEQEQRDFAPWWHARNLVIGNNWKTTKKKLKMFFVFTILYSNTTNFVNVFTILSSDTTNFENVS